MEPFETIYTDTKVVACDGGKGAMGHPRVFLNMGEFDFTDCPYCSRRFVLKAPENQGPKPEPKDILIADEDFRLAAPRLRPQSLT